MPATPSPQLKRWRKGFSRKRALALVSAVAAIAGVCAYYVARWPYREDRIIEALQVSFDSRVTYKRFQKVFFPRPGCVIFGLTFKRGPRKDRPPAVTIEQISLISDYWSILTASKRIEFVYADGLKIRVPSKAETPNPRAELPESQEESVSSSLRIETLEIRKSVLEFARANPNERPIEFHMQNAKFGPIASGKPVIFSASIWNSVVENKVRCSGQFGPWNWQDSRKTPIFGVYSFDSADLSRFEGIAGTVAAKGRFSGLLGQIDVDGDVSVPNFSLRKSHSAPLAIRFRSEVDTSNGDIFFKSLDTTINQTVVRSSGRVASVRGQKGKTAMVKIRVSEGRVQDLLPIFIESARSPLESSIRFDANVYLPPSSKPFVRRVRLKGQFEIGRGHFTKPDTQHNVNKLSERARGETRGENLSLVPFDSRGRVTLQNGVAHFSDLIFAVPGATAVMKGDYELPSEKIDLRGTLHMKARVSQTARGFRSFLLKAVDPLFMRKKAGASLPVKITGTYSHPSFGLNLKPKL